jgi:hypothetical protein
MTLGVGNSFQNAILMQTLVSALTSKVDCRNFCCESCLSSRRYGVVAKIGLSNPITAFSNDDVASPLYFLLIPRICALGNKVVSGLTL